VTDWRRIS